MSPAEHTIERLALIHGRVAVKEGFADGKIRATVPSGAEFHISEDGAATKVGVNFSINWHEGLDN